MERPYLNKFPPFESEYLEHDTSVRLYGYFEKTPSDNDILDEEDENYYARFEVSLNQPETPKDKLEDINLQFILDLLPEGVKPCDVKIDLSIICSAFAVEGTKITFYYKKHIPAQPELYKKHKQEYDNEVKVWEKENKKYEDYIKNKQIKELERQLKEIKGTNDKKDKTKKSRKEKGNKETAQKDN